MQGLNALYEAIQWFLLLSPPVGLMVVLLGRRRYRSMSPKESRRRTALDLGLALCLLGVVTVTLLPLDAQSGLERGMQLRPFASIHEQLTSAISASVAIRMVGFNILLFVPLGFVLRVRPLGWRPTVTAVIVASAVIETLQALLPLGRTTNVDDLLLNTLGGILGAALATFTLCVRWRWQSTPSRSSSRSATSDRRAAP